MSRVVCVALCSFAVLPVGCGGPDVIHAQGEYRQVVTPDGSTAAEELNTSAFAEVFSSSDGPVLLVHVDLLEGCSVPMVKETGLRSVVPGSFQCTEFRSDGNPATQSSVSLTIESGSMEVDNQLDVVLIGVINETIGADASQQQRLSFSASFGGLVLD